MRKYSYALVAVTFAGCVSPPVEVPVASIRFVPEEHSAFHVPGGVKVQGQAFLRQRGGGTVTCAGERVLLLPGTPYFREVVSISKSLNETGYAFGVAIARKTVARRTQCDAQGNFEFGEVPPGSWYVLTEVRWVVGGRAQGGIMGRSIEVTAAPSSPVLLNEPDRI